MKGSEGFASRVDFDLTADNGMSLFDIECTASNELGNTSIGYLATIQCK